MLSPYAKLVIGALTDFVLTASGVLTGAMAVQEAVVLPSPAVWLLAAMFGLGASAKHVRGMLLDTGR